MSLDLDIGALVGYQERDPEGYNQLKSELDAISKWLVQVGVGQYQEPEDCDMLSVRVGPYSYLHYLRRMAAHLAITGELPPPSDENPSKDIYLKQYFEQVFKEHQIGPFDNLIIHGDTDGYYVPLDFAPPVAPPKQLGINTWVIGSTFGLLRECEYLAASLQIPIRAYKIVMGHLGRCQDYHIGENLLTEKYLIESHVCICLILACRRSIRTGSALIFA
jgi:hypothetical protein